MKTSKKKFRRTIATLVSGCVVGSTCFTNGYLIQAEGTTDTKQAENQIISQSPNAVISSNQMNVLVDANFPRVIQYDLKSGNGAGKAFYGQTDALDTILINDVAVKPKVKAKVLSDKVVYEMTVIDNHNNISAVITAELVVKENILEFNITKIVDNKIVKTIEIPNHNLISVNNSQKDAVLDGVQMSTNTRINGDRQVKVDENLITKDEEQKGYMYAFLSTDELSASIWSNTENSLVKKLAPDSYAAKTDAQRITANATTNIAGKKTIGLSSTFWTYQKSEEHRKEDGTLELTDGTVNKVDEMPSVKVIITADANDDKKISWQDGAIAYRKIMNEPLGAEKVPDLVGYRVNMNFGSQAQNPFLMALDGVKKFHLNTDGLGQSILLKGYGSEGHDSGHLNYADIGTRIGGAKDMKTLLTKGKEYGATFGVHVNASETYPESKYFQEDRLLKNPDGTYKYGWNWIDQGININADYDLRNGRAQRFKDLYDALGGKKNDLDFIYVDVWGNGQSGDNSTWPSRQLSKEINSLGWRLGSEWGYANEYDSTFQHWAADLTYGGYTLKGINSTITRFIKNHQKDAWIGNYPKYGGDADAPLLGGYSMKDFEGWQGRSDYKAYIDNLFAVNIPTKFIQHYKVTQWENGKAVEMKDDKQQTYNWVPGMKSVLKDESSENTLTIERKSNDFANDKDGYRTRTMTLNGKQIFEGKPGDEKYLFPWSWNQNGKKLSAENEKLYHWNTNGGKTTWAVPTGWQGTVKVYELTELGKEHMKNVKIENGKITLDAKKSTAYVIYKGPKSNKDVKWSEGMHLIDTGFNSNSLKDWKIKGDSKAVKITKSEGNNNMLTISNNKKKVNVTQKLTDLKPNTKYAAYVGIDNRSEAQASITITSNGKEYTNSTGKSIAKNYVRAYAHNTLGSEQAKADGQMTSTVDGTSYFQNMYVFFETGKKTSDVTIDLSRDGGNGASYFDDIRIVESNAENQVSNNKFVQDFENVVQGIYPFVIGNIEGVEDNRTHLSELHAPYTQRGWNQKIVNDVISGKWSLKTNGLTEGDALVYQTIPQNFTFKPGVTYKITFDYEAGSDGTYAVVTGNAPFEEQGVLTKEELKSTASSDKNAKAGTYSFTLTGDKSGQSWFGIYSTNKAANTNDVKGSQANFNGYKDIMLDNLVIEVVSNK
ncbi:endo-alpha-N-acetylgalactosaminidase family protein [Bacillus mobilis]|uniref:Cell surface protein n=2 Tax=Bacillus cereus group TaxID=86661 RepID=A0A1C4BT08_BACCE|nr:MULTISPECIES: endo-alpha-N-acetylgalactosaminidase family protein [Bacillus cereus group]MCC2460980.1 endo-alpha-N-acetylgalactosaminidase family protein [Bacillus mobilis]MCU5433871.1 endo-alpha-N-acetylgalactosaminidase family protein [Bacillus mobilis]MCU5591536.1 endo-alpha-N-acetylgalactosaminidase family protein [Bacillus mobilis]MCU5738759.1 endo-alpha-N-acetylgalactosaminidase family protein [Bacillus mobilis]MCU9561035.1 endo-alpha-N-acetylgalactosaminidase family protein [Bacillus